MLCIDVKMFFKITFSLSATRLRRFHIYWTKKKRTLIWTGNLIIAKTTQRYCLVWVKSATCRKSSIAKQKFIVVVCSVQQTVKCSKVNNCCGKPCASCATLHVRDMNGLRWVLLARGMSSPTSWVTRHNCTTVSGGWSRDFIWQSVRSLANARWVTGRGERWPGQCIPCVWYGRCPVWGRLRRERRSTITWWSLAARCSLFRMGPRYGRQAHSVNRLRWLRMICVVIWALWRLGVSTTVLLDGLHWSHRCLRRIWQSFDGVVPGCGCGCGCGWGGGVGEVEGWGVWGGWGVAHRALRGWFQVIPICCRRRAMYQPHNCCCVAHWNVWRHLQSSG